MATYITVQRLVFSKSGVFHTSLESNLTVADGFTERSYSTVSTDAGSSVPFWVPGVSPHKVYMLIGENVLRGKTKIDI